MADGTKIEWTDATWNPVTGCSVVSPGCTNCYAMRLAGTRLRGHPSRAGLTTASKAGPVWNGQVRLNEEWLTDPLRRRRPRMIFVCAHGDLFHEAVPDEWIDRVFAVMALSPQHTFQVLTKRSARMRDYLRPYDGRRADSLGSKVVELGYGGPLEALRWPLPNVWLGVSVEDQRRADERIPDLLATPAAVRFVSAEPLLGPVDLTLDGLSCWPCSDCSEGQEIEWDTGANGCRRCEGTGKSDEIGLDWVIVGGESGPGARPMHPDWARSLRDQCQAAQAAGSADGATGDRRPAFFFKQWGAWLPWEPEFGPCWVSQNGKSEDHHILFPVEIDDDPNWDDGLWAIDGTTGHAAFQKVGKARAGALLDGREWREVPGHG